MTVWGNKNTGKLFCPGTKFYGQTKSGRFFENPPIGEKVTPRSRTKVWVPSKKGGSCMV